MPTRRYLAEGEADFVNNTQLYYGTDHLGSVRAVIALPSGAVANRFDYDPYGNPGTTQGSRLTWTDFRYAGLVYDPTSGLYFATHRVYDPKLGRWLSRDPIGERGGVNLYAYVGADPVGGRDPYGLCYKGDYQCMMAMRAANMPEAWIKDDQAPPAPLTLCDYESTVASTLMGKAMGGLLGKSLENFGFPFDACHPKPPPPCPPNDSGASLIPILPLL